MNTLDYCTRKVRFYSEYTWIISIGMKIWHDLVTFIKYKEKNFKLKVWCHKKPACYEILGGGGSCAHGNEPSGSIKCGAFLD